MFNQLHTDLLTTAVAELERVAARGIGKDEQTYLYAKGLLCRLDLLLSETDRDLNEVLISAGLTGFPYYARLCAQVKWHLGHYMGMYKREPEFDRVISGEKCRQVTDCIREIERYREQGTATETEYLIQLNSIREILYRLTIENPHDPRLVGPMLDFSFSAIYDSVQPNMKSSFMFAGPEKKAENDFELFGNNEKFRQRVNFILISILLLYPPLPKQ